MCGKEKEDRALTIVETQSNAKQERVRELGGMTQDEEHFPKVTTDASAAATDTGAFLKVSSGDFCCVFVPVSTLLTLRRFTATLFFLKKLLVYLRCSMNAGAEGEGGRHGTS